MALSRTNLIGEFSGVSIGTGSYITSAATTTLGEWLVVMVFSNSGSTINASNLTIADSTAGANTYTSRMTFDATPSSDMAFRVWTAPVSSAGSTTWTVDAGSDSTDAYGIVVLSYSGADTSGLGATGTGTGLALDGAASFTLTTSPASTSEVIGWWGLDNAASATVTKTPGSAYTELYDISTNNENAECEARTGSTSTTVDLVDASAGGPNFNAGVAAIGFEIKVATSGTNVTVGTATLSTTANNVVAATLPGAPTSLATTPGDTQMGLSWTAPASDGGSALTDYIVQYRVHL